MIYMMYRLSLCFFFGFFCLLFFFQRSCYTGVVFHYSVFYCNSRILFSSIHSFFFPSFFHSFSLSFFLSFFFLSLKWLICMHFLMLFYHYIAIRILNEINFVHRFVDAWQGVRTFNFLRTRAQMGECRNIFSSISDNKLLEIIYNNIFNLNRIISNIYPRMYRDIISIENYNY